MSSTAPRVRDGRTGIADLEGRTDIELTTSTWKVVIEAKQGWIVPEDLQLAKYVGRFDGFDGHLITMSDSSIARAMTVLETDIAGIPVKHYPWDTIRQLIRTAHKKARPRERLWLDELEIYMGTATSYRPYEDLCGVLRGRLRYGIWWHQLPRVRHRPTTLLPPIRREQRLAEETTEFTRVSLGRPATPGRPRRQCAGCR